MSVSASIPGAPHFGTPILPVTASKNSIYFRGFHLRGVFTTRAGQRMLIVPGGRPELGLEESFRAGKACFERGGGREKEGGRKQDAKTFA